MSLTQKTTNNIETRRLELLAQLAIIHPLSIFYQLEQDENIAFTISNSAATNIRRGLQYRIRRENESSALVRVSLVAQTPNQSQRVYRVDNFQFENLGTMSAVVSVERERLRAGEIEVHSHLFTTPDYLGQTDVGDLIAAVEGPAWVDPITNQVNPAIRIFGILSIYEYSLVELQFYSHNLLDNLSIQNNYGLKKLGMPITLPDAY